NEPTMNLAWVERSNVLHEFGHVLGLLHETTNPNNEIPWAEEKIYEEFTRPPNSWTRETIYQNFFNTWAPNHFPVEKPFDPQSIILYAYPNSYFTYDFKLTETSEISAGDLDFLAALYPPNNNTE